MKLATAIPTVVKANTHVFDNSNEQKLFDEDSEVKEELIADVAFHFYFKQLATGIPVISNVHTFKFDLPISYHKLPERPPKN